MGSKNVHEKLDAIRPGRRVRPAQSRYESDAAGPPDLDPLDEFRDGERAVPITTHMSMLAKACHALEERVSMLEERLDSVLLPATSKGENAEKCAAGPMSSPLGRDLGAVLRHMHFLAERLEDLSNRIDL